MSFRDLVSAVLDAAGHAPTGPVGAWSLDRTADVGTVVSHAPTYAIHYGFTSAPKRIDPTDAALCLVILAERETSRGVRTVTATRKDPSR